ncbi:MAG TPA: AEC family transporter [Salinimicrobium sp.]|nr:AEC family transporter [Salinimicrobium sp.]
MLNFILIALCLLAGFLVQKLKALPEDSFRSVNAWVINVAIPAVALKYIPEIHWNFSLILPFLMPFLVWGGSFFFVMLLSRFIKMDSGTRGALFLTAGLGNTSFLGFPLSEAYYGEEGLQIAILCDQACFVVMSTFGIIAATRASNNGNL